MDRIRISDLIDEEHKENKSIPDQQALVPFRKRLRQSPLREMLQRAIAIIASVFLRFRKLDFVQTLPKLKNLNIYRKARERLTNFYLKRTVLHADVKKESLHIFWQPVLFILGKLTLVAAISFWVFGFYPVIGKWLKIGFDFFKLEEIYTFEFPKQPFYDSVAMYLILAVIVYYSVYFLYHQVAAFLSVLVINEAERKVYIVRNVFVRKSLYVFSIQDLALVVLSQSMIGRFFGLGTISLEKKSGELVEIKSVYGARRAVRLLSAKPKKHKETVYDRL
jgi:hypothetical protein